MERTLPTIEAKNKNTRGKYLMSRKVLLGALALGVAVPALVVPMQGTVKAAESDYSYNENSEGEIIITGFQWAITLKEINIPETIKGKPVTGIAKGAFENKKLTKVTLPSGLKRIEERAFYLNQLTEINFPEGLEYIGKESFTANKLENLELPNSVTGLGVNVFNNNQITSLKISTGLSIISEGAFFNNKLTSIVIPENTILIGKQSFGANNLTSISFPKTLETINEKAFNSNELERVIIPYGTEVIWANAFTGNKINSVILPPTIRTMAGNIFSANQIDAKDIVIKAPDNAIIKRYAEVYGHSYELYEYDEETGFPVDPETGNKIDPSTGEQILPEPELPTDPETPPAEEGKGLWSPDQEGGQFVSTMIPEVTVVGGKAVSGITLKKFDYGLNEAITTELGDIKFASDGKGNTVVSMPNGLSKVETNTEVDVKYKGTHILTVVVKPAPKLDFSFGW